MLFWIIVGVGLWLAVAFAVRELVVAGVLRRLRRELLAEALPSALTGVEPDKPVRRPEPALYWVTATNLTAAGTEAEEPHGVRVAAPSRAE